MYTICFRVSLPKVYRYSKKRHCIIVLSFIYANKSRCLRLDTIENGKFAKRIKNTNVYVHQKSYKKIFTGSSFQRSWNQTSFYNLRRRTTLLITYYTRYQYTVVTIMEGIMSFISIQKVTERQGNLVHVLLFDVKTSNI